MIGTIVTSCYTVDAAILMYCLFVCLFVCLFSWRYNPFGCIFHSPVAGFILFILEVSWSHTTMRHSPAPHVGSYHNAAKLLSFIIIIIIIIINEPEATNPYKFSEISSILICFRILLSLPLGIKQNNVTS